MMVQMTPRHFPVQIPSKVRKVKIKVCHGFTKGKRAEVKYLGEKQDTVPVQRLVIQSNSMKPQKTTINYCISICSSFKHFFFFDM